MAALRPGYGFSWQRSLPSKQRSLMPKRWRALFAMVGSMGKSDQKTSTIGFSALHRELREASGPRSTRKRRKHSLPLKECGQQAWSRSNRQSRTEGGKPHTRQRAPRPSLAICSKPLMQTRKRRRFLQRSMAKTGTPSCSAFKTSRKPRHVPRRSLNSLKCSAMAKSSIHDAMRRTIG